MHLVRDPVTHPITGLSFDYERVCNTCAHFTNKTRTLHGVKYRTTKCALDPQQRNLADTLGTSWSALPACIRHSNGDPCRDSNCRGACGRPYN